MTDSSSSNIVVADDNNTTVAANTGVIEAVDNASVISADNTVHQAAVGSDNADSQQAAAINQSALTVDNSDNDQAAKSKALSKEELLLLIKNYNDQQKSSTNIESYDPIEILTAPSAAELEEIRAAALLKKDHGLMAVIHHEGYSTPIEMSKSISLFFML